MSYEQHEWANGETITAEKMNNIEEGIAEAAQSGGGGTATIRLSANDGWSSSSKIFAQILYAIYDGEKWVACSDDEAEWLPVYGYATPNKSIFVEPLSTDENVGLFIEPMTFDSLNMSGDIGDAQNVYHTYGSVLSHDCYRITGNCSIEFVCE